MLIFIVQGILTYLYVFKLLTKGSFFVNIFHIPETKDLPTEVWNFWNYCSFILILSLCLGWTMLPSSSHCGGTTFFLLIRWFIFIFTESISSSGALRYLGSVFLGHFLWTKLKTTCLFIYLHLLRYTLLTI